MQAIKYYKIIFEIYVILILLSLQINCNPHQTVNSHKTLHRKYMRYVGNEDGIRYSQIIPFQWEWNKDFNGTKFYNTVSPVQLWMKCVDMKIKAYFFVMNPQLRFREGHIGWSITSIFKDKAVKMNIYVNKTYSKKIDYYVSGRGGGHFLIDISEFSSHSYINIHINDWGHFSRFFISDCQRSKTQQQQQPAPKYIVNIYTKYYYPDPSNGYNMKYVEGVANQVKYYRCALPLHRYEIIIQKNLIEVFLKNSYLAVAASNGLINFIIKESFVPGNLYHYPKSDYPDAYDNYIFQHIELNVAVLRHWSRVNVRMFMLDPDEYLIYHPSVTLNQLNGYVNKYSTVFMKRGMSYCLSCLQNNNNNNNNNKELEIDSFSFNKHDYRIWQFTTLDKLLVNPNTCGNLVVHWMEGGKNPLHWLNKSTIFIAHFENLLHNRWILKLSDLENKASLTVNNSYPVLQYCDPINAGSFTTTPKQYFKSM